MIWAYRDANFMLTFIKWSIPFSFSDSVFVSIALLGMNSVSYFKQKKSLLLFQIYSALIELRIVILHSWLWQQKTFLIEFNIVQYHIWKKSSICRNKVSNLICALEVMNWLLYSTYQNMFIQMFPPSRWHFWEAVHLFQ